MDEIKRDLVSIERWQRDADLGPILAIERASFSSPWTAEMFLWELRESDVAAMWVARDGLLVAGFCCVWLVLDELHINNVAVAPEFRQRGVAATLLRHVIRDAVEQGATRATLEVRRSNVAALRLYERLGFRQAGVRRNYYSNPVEDALVLWSNLVGEDWAPAAGAT